MGSHLRQSRRAERRLNPVRPTSSSSPQRKMALSLMGITFMMTEFLLLFLN